MIEYPELPTTLSAGNVLIGNQHVFQVLPNPSAQLFCAQNKGHDPIRIGNAVSRHPSGSGVILANADSPSTAAVGLAVQGSPPSFSEIVLTAGVWCIPDWTVAAGTPTLSFMSFYWLDLTSGKLTTISPATGISQIVGQAISSISLLVNIQPPILL